MEKVPPSVSQDSDSPAQAPAPDWFRVGILAAASALAGGLAVAWYYRNTLARLRQAEDLEEDGVPGRSTGNDGEGI